MTTLETWTDFSITVMEENIRILRECEAKREYSLLIEQAKALHKHVESFIDYLEKVRKFG